MTRWSISPENWDVYKNYSGGNARTEKYGDGHEECNVAFKQIRHSRRGQSSIQLRRRKGNRFQTQRNVKKGDHEDERRC